jgi:hypothetical protein
MLHIIYILGKKFAYIFMTKEFTTIKNRQKSSIIKGKNLQQVSPQGFKFWITHTTNGAQLKTVSDPEDKEVVYKTGGQLHKTVDFFDADKKRADFYLRKDWQDLKQL